jgi:hypothetical protein
VQLTTSGASSSETMETKAWVERVVVIGVKEHPAIRACMIQDLQTGEKTALDFDLEGSVLTIKKPGVNIAHDFKLVCKRT